MARRGWRRERAMDLNTGVSSSAGRRQKDSHLCHLYRLWALFTCSLAPSHRAKPGGGLPLRAPGRWLRGEQSRQPCRCLAPPPWSSAFPGHGHRDSGCPNMSKAQPHPCAHIFRPHSELLCNLVQRPAWPQGPARGLAMTGIPQRPAEQNAALGVFRSTI